MKLKFEKRDWLVWECTNHFRGIALEVAESSCAIKYPNSTITIESECIINQQTGEDLLQDKLIIYFKSEADEAEFIIKEST